MIHSNDTYFFTSVFLNCPTQTDLQLRTWNRRHSYDNSYDNTVTKTTRSTWRPPWPRQIITPIFPNVIMLSLGGERLPERFWIITCTHDLGMLPLLWYFFAHLLILEHPNHHQNLISSSLYYQCYQKHNLLCQGGNKSLVVKEHPMHLLFIYFLIM